MDSLIQFTKSLQSSLFTNSTIFVGITPLVFFVKSIEVIILEMSSLLTKLKSNSLIDANTDLILNIQGCMSRCLIAIRKRDMHPCIFKIKSVFVSIRLFDFNYIFQCSIPSNVIEVCSKKIHYTLIFRNYFFVLHHIILGPKFAI